MNNSYTSKPKRRSFTRKYGILSRDINHDENDSDEQNLDKMSCEKGQGDEPPPSQDIWDADEYKNNWIGEEGDGDDSHISESNPFARQRLLKSKYKTCTLVRVLLFHF